MIDSDLITMIIFHEVLAVGMAYIAFRNKKGYIYISIIIFLGILNIHFGILFILILTFLYTVQILYNNLYLLTKKTNASMRRVIIENMIFYHSPLLMVPFLEFFN